MLRKSPERLAAQITDAIGCAVRAHIVMAHPELETLEQMLKRTNHL